MLPQAERDAHQQAALDTIAAKEAHRAKAAAAAKKAAQWGTKAE
ncbi:MAG: hypothetical protein ACRDTA_11065 [Pseudonocardiaceae bacterium]